MSLDWKEIFKTRYVGIIGIAIPLIAIGAIITSIILNSSWFAWTENALSDLGHYGNLGVVALVFNLGLIISGLLTIFFGLGFTWNAKGEFEGNLQYLTILGTLILTGAGVVLLGIGVFSEDFGVIHRYFSILFFVLLPFGMWIIGLAMLFKEELRLFGILGILIGFLGALSWVLYYSQNVIPGNAIPEALASFSVAFWVFLQGFRLYKLEST
ncbi:MAG: DUF998 domain-containing protein [Candidatus Hermodarchaeota archaeon]